jgi:hypothetical protein
MRIIKACRYTMHSSAGGALGVGIVLSQLFRFISAPAHSRCLRFQILS